MCLPCLLQRESPFFYMLILLNMVSPLLETPQSQIDLSGTKTFPNGGNDAAQMERRRSLKGGNDAPNKAGTKEQSSSRVQNVQAPAHLLFNLLPIPWMRYPTGSRSS